MKARLFLLPIAAILAAGGLAACALVGVGAALAVKGVDVVKKTRQDQPMQVTFEQPLKALPAARKVAVWPKDEAVARNLAQDFEVVTPGVVEAHLGEARINPSLDGLNDTSLATNFGAICQRTQSDLVLASREASSGRQEQRAEIFAYVCRSQALNRDTLVLSMPGGPTRERIAQAEQMAAGAWRQRILDAQALGAGQASTN